MIVFLKNEVQIIFQIHPIPKAYVLGIESYLNKGGRHSEKHIQVNDLQTYEDMISNRLVDSGHSPQVVTNTTEGEGDRINGNYLEICGRGSIGLG
jgi:hypothetical protein